MQDVARPRSQSQAAYAILKERILEKQFLAGEILSENVMARELNMSRTPVREAVQKLVQEGLLVVLPSRGIMVATLTVTDVEEIYAIREILEGLASRLAADRANQANLQRLQEILASIQGAVEARNSEEYHRLDKAFHEEIARAAGNQRLGRLLENMRVADVLQQFNASALVRQARLESSLAEHRIVLAAISGRDPDEAEKAMRAHAQSAVRDVLLGAFRASGGS